MIATTHITKKYDDPVLQDFTWNFPTGTVTALVGPNGVGKTTLFKCLLDLERYDGSVAFDGASLADVRSKVVSVFDDAPLYGHLTGRQNLRCFLPDRPVRASGEIADLLIGPDGRWLSRKVAAMSYGQRKRLATLIALGSDPEYVILDEVSNGVEVHVLDSLRVAIAEVARNATIVMSGHDLPFLSTVADVAIAIKDGQPHPLPTPGGELDLDREYRHVFL